MRPQFLSFMTWNTIARHAISLCGTTIISTGLVVADQPNPSRVAVQLDPIGSISGSNRWDWGWDWWQARTASIPGSEPMWLTTMSETGKEGIHDFHESTCFLKHPTFTENTKGRFLTHAPSQSKLISYTHADEFTLAGAQRDKRLPAPSTTNIQVETINPMILPAISVG